MHNQYREEGLIARRGAPFGRDGEGLGPVIRQVIAAQRRILMPLLERCKRLGGRYCQEHASRTITTLDDGTEISTFVNPYGLEPTLQSRVNLSPTALATEYIFDLLPFIIERGMLVFVNNTVRVLLSDDDLSYLEGSGDTWPWGITERAQGVFLAPPGGTLCDTGWIAPQWLTEITIDEYDSYAQAIWTLGIEAGKVTTHVDKWINEGDFDPLPYTGLLRFCAQAKQVNSDIRKLRHLDMPGWDSRFFGIFREVDTDAETLRYWLAYIGPLGTQIVELAHHSTVNCLIDGLYAGAFSGQQELNAEACVLVTLYLPETSTPIELLTTEDMDSAYNGFWHVAHGWHFSPQLSGSVSEDQTAAVTCMRKLIDNGGHDRYWETKAKKVEISFDGVDPSAIISTISTGEPRIVSNSHLWLPIGSNWKYDHNHRGLPQDGLVWADYPDTGPRTVDYDGEDSSFVSTSGSIIAFNECSGGGVEKEGWSPYNGNVATGGFGASISDAGQFSRAEGGGTYAKTTYTETTTTTLDGDFQSFYSQYTLTGGGGGVSCDSLDYGSSGGDCGSGCNRPKATVSLAKMDFWYEQTSVAAGGGHGCAMIIMNDPTAFILSNDTFKKVGSGGSTIYENTNNSGATSVTVYTDHESQCTGCNGTHSLSTGQIDQSGITGAKSVVSIKVGGASTVKFGRVSQDFLSGTPNRVEGDALYSTDAKLFVGSQTISLGSDRTEEEMHFDWFKWNRPSEVPIEITTGLGVWSSYSGEVVYYPRVGADLKDNGEGYDTTILPLVQRIRHLL